MTYEPPTEQQPTPAIPDRVRTGAYVVGALLGVGVAPALIMYDEKLAAVAAALSGACNVLAFGYRPTR